MLVEADGRVTSVNEVNGRMRGNVLIAIAVCGQKFFTFTCVTFPFFRLYE
jgi:hypothetical protein